MGKLKSKHRTNTGPTIKTSNIIGAEKTLLEQIPDKIKEDIIISDYNSYIDKKKIKDEIKEILKKVYEQRYIEYNKERKNKLENIKINHQEKVDIKKKKQSGRKKREIKFKGIDKKIDESCKYVFTGYYTKLENDNYKKKINLLEKVLLKSKYITSEQYINHGVKDLFL
uniref:Uncharacterized protein n=1 Tax=viral metagenome TaxID=1070528 RepID=A0A6C0C4U9_9ZZZZ